MLYPTFNEKEERALHLLRTMTDDQAETWLKIGRALIDESPAPEDGADSVARPPFLS